jgi:hypothetical protein
LASFARFARDILFRIRILSRQGAKAQSFKFSTKKNPLTKTPNLSVFARFAGESSYPTGKAKVNLLLFSTSLSTQIYPSRSRLDFNFPPNIKSAANEMVLCLFGRGSFARWPR